MKQKESIKDIGLIGLGAIGYMILNQLVKSEKKDYSIKLIGRPRATLQFKKYFKQKCLDFSANYSSFLTSPTPQVIILAIPNPVKDTVQSIADNLPSQAKTTIILLQNGVSTINDTKNILTPKKFPHLKIIRGCITNASSRNKFTDDVPAKYDPSQLNISLSPVNKNSSLNPTKNLFKQINFNVKIVKNLDSNQWSKLISGNLSGLSAAVVFEPLELILHDKDLLTFEINSFKERLKVIKTANIKIINLPGFKAGNIAKFVSLIPTSIVLHLKLLIQRSNLNPRSNAMPSTAKKLRSHRPTEIEHYLKPVINLATKHQVDVPLTTKLYQTIKSIESGKIKPWTLSLADRKKLIL